MDSYSQLPMELETNWLRIFSSPPMLDNILKYLSFEEIKNLRFVSSYVNRQLVLSKRFLSCALFTVTKARSETNSVSSGTLLASGVMWRNIKLDLNSLEKVSQQAIEKIRDLCHNHLEYLHANGTSKMFTYENCTIGHDSAFSKLKSLVIDIQNITELRLYGFELLGKRLEKLRFIDTNPNFPKCDIALRKEDLKRIAETFTNLKEFSINFANLSYWPVELRRCIFLILKANAETLTLIDLNSVWDFEEMEKIIFPKLKTVNIDASASGVASEFVKNHPKLEHVKYFGPLGICRMLSVIKGHCSVLKRLIIEGFWELEEHRDDEWHFLLEAPHLQHISFRFYFNTIQLNKTHFWNYLPSTLRTIKTNSINRDARDTPTISSLSTYPFSELTELDLHDGSNPFEDEDLQQICSKLTKLQNLQFGNCKNLTDFGVTGVKDETDTNISIKNLKGLQILSITDCDKLTNKIIRFICFQFLRTLVLDNKMMNIEGIESELELQNPCLDVIHLDKTKLSMAYNKQ